MLFGLVQLLLMYPLRCETGETLVLFNFFYWNQYIQLQEQTSVQTLHSICCHRKCEVSPKQDGRASCADKAIVGVQPDTLYRDLADLKAQKGDPLVHQGELQHMVAEERNYKQARTSSLPLTKGKRLCVEASPTTSSQHHSTSHTRPCPHL